MSTSQLTREDESIDHGDEIAVELAVNGDTTSGLARVIVQVHTNAGHFRGWGPRVLI
ncbi:MAG TPA: hypothetical protein VKF82_10270 [Candidatus Eremiobacteraceae bacterium]|nr:hypothetical protein [Candidatus Eremiobacteraceae bacterium]